MSRVVYLYYNYSREQQSPAPGFQMQRNAEIDLEEVAPTKFLFGQRVRCLTQYTLSRQQ